MHTIQDTKIHTAQLIDKQKIRIIDSLLIVSFLVMIFCFVYKGVMSYHGQQSVLSIGSTNSIF